MTLNRNISKDCIEIIQDTDRLMAQIRDLCEMRALVHLELEGESPMSYLSRFQGIHASGTILVDPLGRPDEEQCIREARRVTASCNLNNRRHEFETSVVGVILGEVPALMLSMPSVMLRIQTRRYARVCFPETSSPSVKIMRKRDASAPLKGAVVQLGEGGMGSNISSPEGLEVGGRVEAVTFALPDGHIVHTPATVRSLLPLYSADGAIRGYRCNLQFEQLEHRHRTMLSAFVFRKQLGTNSNGNAVGA